MDVHLGKYHASNSLARGFCASIRRFIVLLQPDEIRLHVVGNSMLPHLPSGTHVVVQRGTSRVRPGSLIAFRQRGKLIVHRVLESHHSRVGSHFITKGDNNAYLDDPVSQTSVLGRVVAVEQRLGA